MMIENWITIISLLIALSLVGTIATSLIVYFQYKSGNKRPSLVDKPTGEEKEIPLSQPAPSLTVVASPPPLLIEDQYAQTDQVTRLAIPVKFETQPPARRRVSFG